MTFPEMLKAISDRLGAEVENVGGAAGVEVDGIAVVLQDADGDLLLLRTEVGAIPAGHRDDVFAAAMEANYLYRGTGGATLSVDIVNNSLHLHKYTWLERLDAETAFELIMRFAESAVLWRRFLAEVAEGHGNTPSVDLPLGQDGGKFISV